MAEVSLSHLTKVYHAGVKAVDDVSLKIADREFVVLVGPSGSGKSTILRLIAGLEELTGGHIFINGKKVNDVPPKDRDIAMVFQDFALYPHLSVFDNIAFGLRMRKVHKEEIRQRVGETARVLSIQHLLERKPRQISGGEKQRVALGRAIVRHPGLFLMDEPLSNLDAKLRVQMRMEIHRLYRSLDATVIYVTHDQTEAMTMGTKIVVLKDGVIQQAAAPREVYARPANTFVASFIGTPPMNLLTGQLVAGPDSLCFRWPDGSLSTVGNGMGARLDLTGREAVMGIRPEHIRISTNGSEPEGAIAGEVEVVENLGADSYASVTIPGGSLLARLPGEAAPAPGDRAHLVIAADRVHLFDAASGERLTENGHD